MKSRPVGHAVEPFANGNTGPERGRFAEENQEGCLEGIFCAVVAVS
jgi:hypothetical protein